MDINSIGSVSKWLQDLITYAFEFDNVREKPRVLLSEGELYLTGFRSRVCSIISVKVQISCIVQEL